MAATKHHDYHLVDPDPWPIIGAMGAFALFGGAVMWFHDNPYGKFVGIGGLLVATDQVRQRYASMRYGPGRIEPTCAASRQAENG